MRKTADSLIALINLSLTAPIAAQVDEPIVEPIQEPLVEPVKPKVQVLLRNFKYLSPHSGEMISERTIEINCTTHIFNYIHSKIIINISETSPTVTEFLPLFAEQ